jgi:hypothetical protein
MLGISPIGASTDLQLGNLLDEQRRQETEEERKKRISLGLGGSKLDFGRTGVASMDLGLVGGGR